MEVRTKIQAHLQVCEKKQTAKSMERETHGNQCQITQKAIRLIKHSLFLLWLWFSRIDSNYNILSMQL